MTDEELIALFSVAGTVIAALVGAVAVILSSLRRTRYEITNDHDDPLRDDMDSKHDQLMSMARHTRRDVAGMREDIRQLRRDLSHTDERVDEIDERTRPPLTKGTP